MAPPLDYGDSACGDPPSLDHLGLGGWLILLLVVLLAPPLGALATLRHQCRHLWRRPR